MYHLVGVSMLVGYAGELYEELLEELSNQVLEAHQSPFCVELLGKSSSPKHLWRFQKKFSLMSNQATESPWWSRIIGACTVHLSCEHTSSNFAKGPCLS